MFKMRDFESISAKNILINIGFALILPSFLYCLCLLNLFAITTFKIVLFLCFVLFVILPIIFKYSYNLQRKVVFLNFVNYSDDYARPEKYGLNNSRNIYLTTDEGVKLGVWQILSKNSSESNVTDDNFDNIFDNGENVIIYYHGNAGSRASKHRIELYKVLAEQFHVVAFDYRGYGDSLGVKPFESGVINDSMFMYQWVANRTNSKIFIWGHSLGTSISTHAVLNLQSINNLRRPSGLILEAPFNNFKDEIREFPLAKVFRHLPWFDYTVLNPILGNFAFETDKYICHVNVPIMILHARDDAVVPYRLGHKLFETANKCRTVAEGKLYFHTFDGNHGYGHKWICRVKDLGQIIRFASTQRCVPCHATQKVCHFHVCQNKEVVPDMASKACRLGVSGVFLERGADTDTYSETTLSV